MEDLTFTSIISAVERAGLAELKEGQKINFDVVADERTGEVFAENLSVPPNGQEGTRMATPVSRFVYRPPHGLSGN